MPTVLHDMCLLCHMQADQEQLLPPLSSVLRHVRLWSDYFLRWSPVPSFMPLPLPLRGTLAAYWSFYIRVQVQP